MQRSEKIKSDKICDFVINSFVTFEVKSSGWCSDKRKKAEIRRASVRNHMHLVFLNVVICSAISTGGQPHKVSHFFETAFIYSKSM